ncbi:MAG: hypothetical protein V1929_00715 [bacterium]
MTILKRIAVILALLLLCCSTGCATPVGLKRTPLTNFSYRAFSSVGIEILLPEQPSDFYSKYFVKVYDSEQFYKNTGTKASVVIDMHPSWSGQPLTEPHYFLTISLTRMTPQSLAQFQQGKHDENTDFVFSFAYSNLCTSIQEAFVHDKNSNFDYQCFRKDCPLPQGDVVIIGADLLHYQDRNPNEKEDIEAIRRILDSIRPL